MKTRFKRRAIYQKIDYYGIEHAIIVYRVSDYEQKAISIGDGPGQYFTYVSKTKHELTLDLWLFLVRFDWFRDHKEPERKPSAY